MVEAGARDEGCNDIKEVKEEVKEDIQDICRGIDVDRFLE